MKWKLIANVSWLMGHCSALYVVLLQFSRPNMICCTSNTIIQYCRHRLANNNKGENIRYRFISIRNPDLYNTLGSHWCMSIISKIEFGNIWSGRKSDEDLCDIEFCCVSASERILCSWLCWSLHSWGKIIILQAFELTNIKRLFVAFILIADQIDGTTEENF